ncbi:TlpA disulfide reductase family protein [Alloalcanivorax gelatiniphagus]
MDAPGTDTSLSLRDWSVSGWLNVQSGGYSVDDLAGRVVLAAAFQMLCPGCVEQTVPQLRRAAATFPVEQVAVVGLHTVFEHHEAMTPLSLEAFLHEYRVGFPVAVDEPARRGPTPVTMERFSLRGTPTVMLYDRAGLLRRRTFGHVPDLQLGSEITALVLEGGSGASDTRSTAGVAPVAGMHPEPGCDDAGCRR